MNAEPLAAENADLHAEIADLRDRLAKFEGGYLGRKDWAPSGDWTILSGRDGMNAPAYVTVNVGDGDPVSGEELATLTARLNGDPR